MPRDEPRFVLDVTVASDGTNWWATLSDTRMVLTTVRGPSSQHVMREAAKIADRLMAEKAAA